VTLSILFNVIDSNSDNLLTKNEFKHKVKGLHIGFEPEEIEALFVDLDVNNDGSISYDEFIQ
jgi:Ca2+-binding EF-hand superfamily protein